MAGYTPQTRDVVFVPVGLAYDRVLEDRILTAAAAAGTRQFRGKPLAIFGFVCRVTWQKLRRRFMGFGTAAAAFGPPVSLRSFMAEHDGDVTEALGSHLMAEIVKVVPMLPVPLVAAALTQQSSAGNTPSRAILLRAITHLIEDLDQAGAVLKLPPLGVEAALAEGLAPLIARGLVTQDFHATPGSQSVLDFYAAGVLQRLGHADDAATQQT